MPDFFRIEGLSAVQHTDETRKKLNALNGNKSSFIREAILDFANREGFNWSDNGTMPDFITPERWKQYQRYQARSERKKSNRVDYIYLIAHDWLAYKIKDLSSSQIQRRAILNF